MQREGPAGRAGFDINYSSSDTAGDEMNIIDDRIPVLPVIEMCTFQRNTIINQSMNYQGCETCNPAPG